MQVLLICSKKSYIKFNTKFIFAYNGQKSKKKEGYQKKAAS